MSAVAKDPFGAIDTLKTPAGEFRIWRLDRLKSVGPIDRLPFSIKVLLENALRNLDGLSCTADHVRALANWKPNDPSPAEVPFMPARVVLQDFTGVPCIVDLAAMRSAVARAGGDPKRINPLVPVDLVIDHSVQVDVFGRPDALAENSRIEFERNRERYEFLRWGQQSFRGLRIVPPATGIVHQVNLEYLASVVTTRTLAGTPAAFPDTLVGTDSHTTMINGLGVLGWGVGGIEAEANMLGQPIYMLVPDVIGFRLTGRLRPGATATDLVLTATQMLRKKGVVGKFVEFFGAGLSTMSLADRATLSNMAPEYGATMGFFPVDAETLAYMRRTGRDANGIALVEQYCKLQGLFRTDDTPDPVFSDTLTLDLATVEPSLAGPKRPQDRVPLPRVKAEFAAALTAPVAQRGFALNADQVARTAVARDNSHSATLRHGSVVIAAITSCTNTSNPAVMMAAGLLAKKAVERGLARKPWVKTSLAPGSRVVSEYLDAAGLTPFLEKLGFHTVGYGCTTCIGNSGPLPTAIEQAVKEADLVVAAVLSGNRNFEGRVHAAVKANYLASPPLVVAYAIAGSIDIDLATEPLGRDAAGQPVMLRDLWPDPAEVEQAMARFITPEMFRRRYADVLTGDAAWRAISVAAGDAYRWNESSTYIQEPPFFVDLPREPGRIGDIQGARALAVLGDSITTDHISPAGSIAPSSPAGKYLLSLGVSAFDFNSYGARRGNDRVMVRGTFANLRLRNALAGGAEGGVTVHLPGGEPMAIHDAAMRYRESHTPLVILAGAEYGSGSSRDWAAKGVMLLGVRAVLAVSFERIHRSNLVGMGVLPLQFKPGQTRESLGLTGHETFDVRGLSDALKPGQALRVTATAADGKRTEFEVSCRIDTPIEVEYYRHGGILQMVLRNLSRG
ncbi:MAG: aconitate hydratase AcnA [Phycisphaerae bacterium]